MKAVRSAHPLIIHLPDQTIAELVAGTHPPRYQLGKEALAIDVTIPEDLIATGWYWSGSFLCQPHPPGMAPGMAPGTNPGICIITSIAGPPGWDYTADGRCRVPGPWPSIYQTARWFDERWRLHQAERAAKTEQPQKKPKRVKQQTTPVAPEAVLAAEQMELAL